MFVSTFSVDYFIRKLNISKLAFVITEKGDEISQKLISTSPRGVTAVDVVGAYTGDNKKMLVCALKENEITAFQIKIIIIFRTDGARTMHQLITATGCMSTHPAIRQFPLMIRQDSGRIYHKFFFQSRFFYQMKHHAFSRRATADISKADKQYLFHNFSFNRFKNKSNDNFAECPERA